MNPAGICTAMYYPTYVISIDIQSTIIFVFSVTSGMHELNIFFKSTESSEATFNGLRWSCERFQPISLKVQGIDKDHSSVEVYGAWRKKIFYFLVGGVEDETVDFFRGCLWWPKNAEFRLEN